jgi:hypothetical protein
MKQFHPSFAMPTTRPRDDKDGKAKLLCHNTRPDDPVLEDGVTFEDDRHTMLTTHKGQPNTP